MAKFREKPVLIEAMLWDGTNTHEVRKFFCKFTRWYYANSKHLVIMTLEGNQEAIPGDWIIKDVKGEFYPCKPDLFHSIYELEGASE